MKDGYSKVLDNSISNFQKWDTDRHVKMDEDREGMYLVEARILSEQRNL